MNGLPYLDAIWAAIPDTLGSLDATIHGATAWAPLVSAKVTVGMDALTLAKSLKEGVRGIQDVLDSDDGYMKDETLKSVYDAIECCRLLASALSPDLLDGATADTGPPVASSWFNQGDKTVLIAKGLIESMDFLCEISDPKSAPDQGSSLQKRRHQKYARCIRDSYQSLTLFLYDRFVKGDEAQSATPPDNRCARRASFPGQDQLCSKFRDLDLSFFRRSNSPEARISRSIDQQIRRERLQPWSRADVLLIPQETWLSVHFKASLVALTCGDKQQYKAELQHAASKKARDLLRYFSSSEEVSVSDEARARALELRAQLAASEGRFTDKGMDIFEQLWRFEGLSSLSHVFFESVEVDEVLGNIRRVMQDNYILTTADAALALMKEGFRAPIHLAYCDKQVDIVDPRCSEFFRKSWKHRFEGIPTILFVFNLAMYDQYCDDTNTYSVCLDTFESVAQTPVFRDTTFLLFLVNVTEFSEKLRRIPMEDYIPSFTGGNDPHDAAAYICDQFASKVKSRHLFRARIGNFLDPRNVDFIFASVDHAMRQRDIKKRLRNDEFPW